MVKFPDVPDQFKAAAQIQFSADSSIVYLVKRTRCVDAFQLTAAKDNAGINGITHRETIVAQTFLKAAISHIVVSHGGGYLVLADICGNISVWKRSRKGGWAHHINLPKYSLAPVAMAMHKNSPKLVAAFADGKILEYHLEESRFLCASSRQLINNQDTHVIRNIALDPRNEDVFILHNEAYLFTVKKVCPIVF